MKTNKKAISVILAMVIVVISSCMTFAKNEADVINNSKATTYQKTTVFSNDVFKSNTIINGKIVSVIEYPCETALNELSCETQHYTKKDNKLISYQPLIDIKRFLQQIDTEVESIKADANTKIKSTLSSISVYMNEPTTKKIFTETTQNTTKQLITESITEITTNDSVNINSNVAYSDYVKKVIELTNAERAKYGLQPLIISNALGKAAQKHAEDMSSKNYFSHISQDGRTMLDRINKYLSDYTYAGENIAFGYDSPESVVQCWMSSEGHKANILQSNFKYIGVGYSESYWVQDFSG